MPLSRADETSRASQRACTRAQRAAARLSETRALGGLPTARLESATSAPSPRPGHAQLPPRGSWSPCVGGNDLASLRLDREPENSATRRLHDRRTAAFAAVNQPVS